MKEKLIYEKRYQHSDCKEIEPETPAFSGFNFGFGVYSDTQYTSIPCRGKISEEFIRAAIDISKLYQIDAQILEHREKIQINLSLDFGCKMQHISRLFSMADRITFYKDQSERDLSVCLDLYTHVVVKSGVAVAP